MSDYDDESPEARKRLDYACRPLEPGEKLEDICDMDNMTIMAWTSDEDMAKPIVLSPEAFAKLEELIENPPPYNEALKKLLRGEYDDEP